jgi:hypothetical protein
MNKHAISKICKKNSHVGATTSLDQARQSLTVAVEIFFGSDAFYNLSSFYHEHPLYFVSPSQTPSLEFIHDVPISMSPP